ncbi:MAG: hypothetical protein SGILL_008216 [Bacillariaceae sp.]
MHVYFDESKDEIWKLSYNHVVDPSNPVTESYENDTRLKTAFEKSFAKAILGKIRAEQEREDEVLWCFTDAATMGPAFQFTKPLKYYTARVRPDTAHAIMLLVESNIVEWLRRAGKICCARTDSNEFPNLDAKDVKNALEFDKDMRRNMRQFTARLSRVFPNWQGLVRRLANRAGIIKINGECVEYIGKLILFLCSDILHSMSCNDDLWDDVETLQHPANIHTSKFPVPGGGPISHFGMREWAPVPGMVTLAAKQLKLPIHTVYEHKDGNSLGLEFKKYYEVLSEVDKKRYDKSLKARYDPCNEENCYDGNSEEEDWDQYSIDSDAQYLDDYSDSSDHYDTDMEFEDDDVMDTDDELDDGDAMNDGDELKDD